MSTHLRHAGFIRNARPSLLVIAVGTIVLRRESCGRPVRTSLRHWSVIVLGGITIVVSFCWDFRNVMAGGLPNPFQWSIFAVGETVGLGGSELTFHEAWIYIIYEETVRENRRRFSKRHRRLRFEPSVAITDARNPNRGCSLFDCATMNLSDLANQIRDTSR